MIGGDNPAPGQAATDGTILDAGLYREWGRGGLRDHYRPTVRYVVDGAQYAVRYDRTVREPALGSRVMVIYELDAPERAIIPLSVGERWEAVVLTGLGAIFGAWAYLAQVRPARRTLRARAQERAEPREPHRHDAHRGGSTVTVEPRGTTTSS